MSILSDSFSFSFIAGTSQLYLSLNIFLVSLEIITTLCHKNVSALTLMFYITFKIILNVLIERQLSYHNLNMQE